MGAHGEEGVFYIPIHPPEQGSAGQPSPRLCLAEGPQQGVHRAHLHSWPRRVKTPLQACARLPEPPELTGQPAALEAASGGDAAFLCYWTSLVQSHSDT